MKKVILIVVFVIAGLIAVYLLPKITKPPENKFERQILSSESYPEAVLEIAGQINDLSPTPPTAETWIVRELEFVKGDPHAYVIYHDTHNVFRILIETGKGRYRTVAAFEPVDSGWKLAGGKDLAKGKETVRIMTNNQ